MPRPTTTYATYLLAIAVQKGLPFALIPLVVHLYGRETYAEYVLIFATVQFASLAMDLGTGNAAIVFWHRYASATKGLFLRRLLGLEVKIHLWMIPLCVLVLWMTGQPNVGSGLTVQWLVLTIAYAILYNFLKVLLNVTRAQERAGDYLSAVLAGAVVLVVLLILVNQLSTTTVALTLCFISTVAIQSSVLGYGRRDVMRQCEGSIDPNAFRSDVLSYSLPMAAYAMLSVSFVVADKWFISTVASRADFGQYVIDFQFANAVNLVSVVLGMHLLPIACRLLEEGELRKLRSFILKNYLACIAGSAVLAFAAYTYASITGLALSSNFFFFAAAFSLANIFTINVGVLESQLDSLRLVRLTVLPTIAFWGMMLWLGPRGLQWIAVGYVIYYGTLALSSTYGIMRPRAQQGT